MQWKSTVCAAVTVLVSLAAAAAPEHSASAVYVVSYYEVIAPSQGGAMGPAPDQLLLEQQRALARQPGAVSVELLRDSARRTHYTIIEVWDKQSDYAAAQASAPARQSAAALEPWLAAPRDVRVYTPFR